MGQKSRLQTLQRHNKYVCSCKSLPSIVLSLTRQIILYSPGCRSTIDVNINFPSLLRVISSLSFFVLLLLHKKTIFFSKYSPYFSTFFFSSAKNYFPSPNIFYIFLLCSSSPPQKKLFSFSKHFPSPNIVPFSSSVLLRPC